MSSYCVHTWGSTERKLPDSGHFRCLLKLATRKGWACVPTTWRKGWLPWNGSGFSRTPYILRLPETSITRCVVGNPKGDSLWSSLCFTVFGSRKKWGAGAGLRAQSSLTYSSGSIRQVRQSLCPRALSLQGPFSASWSGPGWLGGGSLMGSETCSRQAPKPHSSCVPSFATCHSLSKI